MDPKIAAVIATTITAVAQAAAAVVVASYDGRSNPNPIRQPRSSSVSMWHSVKNDPLMEDTWFPENLRCSKRSLLEIRDKISPYWSSLHGKIAKRSKMQLFDIMALTFHYLSHAGYASLFRRLQTDGHLVWNVKANSSALGLENAQCYQKIGGRVY